MQNAKRECRKTWTKFPVIRAGTLLKCLDYVRLGLGLRQERPQAIPQLIQYPPIIIRSTPNF